MINHVIQLRFFSSYFIANLFYSVEQSVYSHHKINHIHFCIMASSLSSCASL